VTLRTFTVSVQGQPASGFTREAGFDISGTFTDGQSVTITDTQSRFGTKIGGGKPWIYQPMSGSYNPDPTYSRGTAIALGDAGFEYMTTFDTSEVCPSGGTGVLKSVKDDSHGSWGVRGISNGFCYVFTHRRYNWDVFNDAVSSNLKSFRMRTQFGGVTPPNCDIYISLQSANYPRACVTNFGYPTLSGGIPQTSRTNLDTAHSTIRQQNWHRFELEFRPSSAYNVADCTLVPWINGARPTAGGTSTQTWPNGTDGFISHGNGTVDVTTVYDDIFFDQISNNLEPAGAAALYGPTLWDDSRCRVIVSDEATWNTSSTVMPVRDFCVPTTWAAGSITFLLRQGVHSTLFGKYLWVVKSDGSALKIGRFT
jgi:hypothetical protein